MSQKINRPERPEKGRLANSETDLIPRFGRSWPFRGILSQPIDGPNAPVLSPQAKVLGRIDYHRTAAPRRGSERGGWVGWWLFRFFSLLIPGAVFLSISRVWTDRVAATMARQPGLSAAVGIAGVIVVPVVSVVLMITVIGIPLALLLLALHGVALLLAGVFVA
jgi:hypothetical protein